MIHFGEQHGESEHKQQAVEQNRNANGQIKFVRHIHNHNPYVKSDGATPRDKMTIMLTDRPSYQALESHYRQIHQRHLRDLFAEDPARGERMSAEAAGLYLN